MPVVRLAASRALIAVKMSEKFVLTSLATAVVSAENEVVIV